MDRELDFKPANHMMGAVPPISLDVLVVFLTFMLRFFRTLKHNFPTTWFVIGYFISYDDKHLNREIGMKQP